MAPRCATSAGASRPSTSGRCTIARQALPPLNFDYHAAPLKLADDGHTVRVRFGRGSELRIGKERYGLQQFHFHTPGGDRIAGEEFPMAAHLLHKSASGQLLAVVVLFRLGTENPLLASLLPLIPARADGDHSPMGVMVERTQPAAVWPWLFPLSGFADRAALHRGRGMGRPEAAAGALPRAAGALPAALCRQCPGGAAAARTRGARKSLRPAMPRPCCRSRPFHTQCRTIPLVALACCRAHRSSYAFEA
jgi:hypothetical protein